MTPDESERLYRLGLGTLRIQGMSDFQDKRVRQEAARRNLEHGYSINQRALEEIISEGQDVQEIDPPTRDMLVAGDLKIEQQQTNPPKNGGGILRAAIIGAAILGAGGLGAAVVSLLRSAPSAQQPAADKDTRTTIVPLPGR